MVLKNLIYLSGATQKDFKIVSAFKEFLNEGLLKQGVLHKDEVYFEEDEMIKYDNLKKYKDEDGSTYFRKGANKFYGLCDQIVGIAGFEDVLESRDFYKLYIEASRKTYYHADDYENREKILKILQDLMYETIIIINKHNADQFKNRIKELSVYFNSAYEGEDKFIKLLEDRFQKWEKSVTD